MSEAILSRRGGEDKLKDRFGTIRGSFISGTIGSSPGYVKEGETATFKNALYRDVSGNLFYTTLGTPDFVFFSGIISNSQGINTSQPSYIGYAFVETDTEFHISYDDNDGAHREFHVVARVIQDGDHWSIEIKFTNISNNGYSAQPAGIRSAFGSFTPA